MPFDFRMPSLGPDMEAGTLVEWRVKPGDTVRHGDVVALVETDKGIIDVEIFADGTVERLLVEPGTHVPVGTPLAQLAGEGGSAMPGPPAATPTTGPALPETPQHEAVPTSLRTAERLRISPAARAKARELGVDPAQIAGSGPGGAITLDDVVAHVPQRDARPPSDGKPDGMREVIARAMVRSKREIPHYYLTLTCPLQVARAWLDRRNAEVSVADRLLPVALFLKAVADAAHQMPAFNGFYHEQGFVASAEVHVGVAIAMRGGGLVAPAILDAHSKTAAQVMQELRDLTTRVRSGHMRSTELAQPTITVTSLGEEGVETVLPVIYPPQVAMVGFGAVVDRPWALGDAVTVVPTVSISLAADHRVTDGRAGARFLARIRDALQTPENL